MALEKVSYSVSADSPDSVHMEFNDSGFGLKWVQTFPPTERILEAGECKETLRILKVSVSYVLLR